MERLQNACKDMVVAWRMLVDRGAHPLDICFETIDEVGGLYVCVWGVDPICLGPTALTDEQLADGRDGWLAFAETADIESWKQTARGYPDSYVAKIEAAWPIARVGRAS